MNFKNTIYLIVIIIALFTAGAVGYYFGFDVGFEKSSNKTDQNTGDNSQTYVNSFEECEAAGNPVMESYPRQCRSASGELFVEEIAEPEYSHDLIVLNSPQPNETITSPMTITGEARGNWYFEASFPIVLTNWDGLIIAEGYATAQDDWMTEDFVPFEATLEFDSPVPAADAPEFFYRGYLILQKDNPSGLPEHDDAFEIPIRFTY